MALTRRQFLKRSATLAAGATVAPGMRWMPNTNVAYAAGPSDAIVVFVQLYGGNDGLNTVYPLDGAQRSTYVDYRPTLKLPTTVGELAPWANSTDPVFNTSNGILEVGMDGAGDSYALHPAMRAMHNLYTSGNLAIVPGVHYPYANYSHFASEVIYYTGDPITAAGSGWMGKYLDLAGFTGTDVPAVMLGGEYNPLFTPTGTSLFAFNSLRSLRFPAGSRRTQRSTAFQAMCAESALSDPLAYPELVTIGNAGYAAVDKFEDYYNHDTGLNGKVESLLLNGEGNYEAYNELVWDSPLNASAEEYGWLTEDMRHVAATIRSDVGARFFHVGIGGFDTHSNQEQGLYHSALLRYVSDAIGQLWAELSSSITLPPGYSGYLTGDLSDRVIIVTLSEFGRTSKQNAQDINAAGTDHGRSAPQFVVGPSSLINPGIHGTYPVIADPDLDNDLRNSFDYRDFYGTILERWLNVPVSDIGPGLGKLFASTPVADWLGQSYTSYTPIPFLNP
jgi:uncharacterized protein (DUF1501 family)